MKKFFLVLFIAFVVFTIFMLYLSSAQAKPSKSPFSKKDLSVHLEAPKAYVGHYVLKGSFGPSDVLADGATVRLPTCYNTGMAHKSDFTLENKDGAAVINETELKGDYLFSLSHLNTGVRLGHTLMKRGRMTTIRFLELKQKGNKVIAEGYMLKVDDVSGDVYCSSSLKMRGSLRRY